MSEYYFNLPSIERLTTTQQAAVNDTNAIALSGGPGTGKSVVSLWRHILNHKRNNPINSQLLTYTTSLAYYLKACCKSQSEKAALNVDSTKNWLTRNYGNRDEIIHDEAQDIPLSLNNRLKEFSNKISYGADNQQLIIGGARINNGFDLERCSPEEKLRESFRNSLHSLSENFRNNKKIMILAKILFPNAAIPLEIIESCIDSDIYPRLIISRGNINKQNEAILDIINQFIIDRTTNIAILVPFENKNSIANETSTAQYYYDFLLSKNIDCSIYTNKMNGCREIKNVHITTFKSAKGLEFDVVIIPNFHLMNNQFKVIDWRDYYVGVTRTRRNLYLFSNIDFQQILSEGKNKIIDKVIL